MAKKPQTRTEKEVKDFLTQQYRRLGNLGAKDLTDLKVRRHLVELRALNSLAELYGFLEVTRTGVGRTPVENPVKPQEPLDDEFVTKMLRYMQNGGDRAAASNPSPSGQHEIRSDGSAS